MIVYVPYFDTLIAGSPGAQLVANMRYIFYSHPISESFILSGFNANFSPSGVTVTLQNKTDKDVWSPFFHTSLHAVAGIFSDVEAYLKLPYAVEIKPFSRIQIAIENQTGENINNCLLTLVGVRVLDREVICFN